MGDEKVIPIDVRLISATNRDLEKLMGQNKLREDFYYRIRVFPIEMPPLRKKREDIPLLLESFLSEFSQKTGKDRQRPAKTGKDRQRPAKTGKDRQRPAKTGKDRQRPAKTGKDLQSLSRDALDFLLNYSWPGNVRELKNAIEHAFVLAQSSEITLLDLPGEIRQSHPPFPSSPFPLPERDSQKLEEKTHIEEALQKSKGNRTQAAKILGYSRVTLWKKIRKLGIEVDDYKE